MRVCAKAWGCWRDSLLSQKSQRLALSKGLTRWQNKALLSACSSWRRLVSQVRAASQLKNNVLRCLLQRSIRSAWNTWEARACEGRRLQRILSRIVVRWSNCLIALAWCAWLNAMLVSADDEHMALEALRRWRELVRESQRKREEHRNKQMLLRVAADLEVKQLEVCCYILSWCTWWLRVVPCHAQLVAWSLGPIVGDLVWRLLVYWFRRTASRRGCQR